MIENWPGRGFYRGDKAAMIADAARLQGIVATPPNMLRTPRAPGHDDAMRPTPAIEATLTSREMVRSQGFTGDTCSNCGGAHMQVAGHCTVCADCGTTTGCS